MVYENELYAPLEIGKVIPAYVKQVRDDGKIDLVLSGGDDGRVDALMDKIVRRLEDQPECFCRFQIRHHLKLYVPHFSVRRKILRKPSVISTVSVKFS